VTTYQDSPYPAALYEGLALLLYRQSRLEEACRLRLRVLRITEALGDDFGLCPSPEWCLALSILTLVTLRALGSVLQLTQGQLLIRASECRLWNN